jgi:hypothetical protein
VKKVLLVVLTLSLMIGMIYAQEMQAGPQKAKLASPAGIKLAPSREVPAYSFTVPPVSLMDSYYDYMIGNYNALPLRVIPESAGGGYFMSYHGSRTNSTAATARRAFYSYISNTGAVLANNEITTVTNREGYTSVAVDPVSGKPLYSWHANHDTEALLEIEFTSDAFLDGLAGLFNDVVAAVDNPISITSPSGVTTSANEFIWPTNVIGPSPIAGMRRIYILGRNSVSAPVGAPSENPYIAYADFDADTIEAGVPLVWSYTHIPEMDNWNADSVNWRRPSNAFCADNFGNIYYVGYHFAYVGTDGDAIVEPDIDVFKCGNYGQGTWERFMSNGDLPSLNPLDYFTDADNNDIPYTDEQMRWTISNSSHINAVVDATGKIHVAAIWALGNDQGSYWPAFQFIKEFTFDPQTTAFNIKEIYPQTDDPAGVFQPWDVVAPWGDVDEVDENGFPLFVTDWPFCYWDDTVHDAAMMFHYNNIKLSEANAEGQMVCVWQNSWRARQANYYSNTDYTAYANVPEIYIAVSPDNGGTWSEPIVLNRIETPALTGIKPMWVYPADKVKFTGMVGDQEKGKIGLMFYDDTTWGSFANTPPVHPTNDGGRIMFAELEITFPLPDVSANNDVVTPVASMLQQNYPNPFNPTTTISFNMPKTGNVNLSVYNVKGQLVKTLVNSTQTAGSNSVVWNGDDNSGSSVTSGIYFYKVTTNGKSETRKMMLMK